MTILVVIHFDELTTVVPNRTRRTFVPLNRKQWLASFKVDASNGIILSDDISLSD